MFADAALFPVICILAHYAGYKFIVHSGIVYAVVTTLIYVTVSLILIYSKDKRIDKGTSLVTSVLLILNQVNLLFFALKTQSSLHSTVARLMIALWLVFTIIVVAFYVKNMGLKVSFLVLAGLMIFPMCFILMFENIGSDTVTASVTSPDGRYCAEVIDSDQGALGGDTLVLVYSNRGSFSVGSFEFRKKERSVYRGDWGESRDMTISWNDENELIINGEPYKI